MTSLDTLPPRVREMLEDLRERAAGQCALVCDEAPWGAGDGSRRGLLQNWPTDNPPKWVVTRTVAERIRALPLTPAPAPPGKEETCDCGRLEDPHERTGDCPAHACMYCRDKFSRVAGQHFVNGEWATPCIEWKPPVSAPPEKEEHGPRCFCKACIKKALDAPDPTCPPPPVCSNCGRVQMGPPFDVCCEGCLSKLRRASPAPPVEGEEPWMQEWRDTDYHDRNWIINRLLHATATGPEQAERGPERKRAARLAINVLAAWDGYSLALDDEDDGHDALSCPPHCKLETHRAALSPAPTVEARAALIEWMDSPCPHYNTPDADSKNECYLCIDTFRQAGVERVEKAQADLARENLLHIQRIAYLEAELARERACHDCKEYRLMMAEQVRGLEAELARSKEALILEEINGAAIMEIRASLHERFGPDVDAAFFDDVVHNALILARRAAFLEAAEWCDGRHALAAAHFRKLAESK